MKYEVLPAPAPTSPTPKEIHDLQRAVLANRGQWIRIKLDDGDVLSAEDVQAWRFGEAGVEVRHDEGSLTPRWIDVRIAATPKPARMTQEEMADWERKNLHSGVRSDSNVG